MKEMQVPDVVPYSSSKGVSLNCSYDLEEDDLYSIKWFKERSSDRRRNNRRRMNATSYSQQNSITWDEFYRFLPKNDPQTQIYSTLGVHVDVSLDP